MSAAAFAEVLDVPRETLARLTAYIALLRHWQRRINLVSGRSLDDVWRRHVYDSAQLLRHIPKSAGVIADIGSGAGFPGLVLAIMGAGEVHLIESDHRKCAFLDEAIRQCQVSATVHCARAETLHPLEADVVTARAVAPLARLLPWMHRHSQEHTVGLLLKGKNVAVEIQDVERRLTADTKYRSVRFSTHPSRSDPSGVILGIRGLRS